MIGRLSGTLVEKFPPEILIECAGVGYEVTMPMTSIYALPELHEQVIIYTHFVVREDAQLLYGFANTTERKLFRLLIKVNGVGPKLALAVLSAMSADQFVSYVAHDDVSGIVKIPGVGKKTAERLLIEMRDRLKDWQVTSLTPATDAMPVQLTTENTFVNDPFRNNKGDAINALISLGYKQVQADKAVKAVYNEGMSSEDIIRLSLKSML
ncbi:Holliday junction branch migration protein RuvA [Colwellia sp. 4_MG-2023]|uniref:Holliday junction branch migration protein RuvA n=1 Tax=unclassified Colwellia TaxID=196834 RepID=UPI001C0A5218|nr:MULTISPECIES: Holliday junction branch migration protein RuvA [unclassified Colwellia]MBU2925729.1 Holliday junction branch migration protein RuvA [Colwellia sp. C2M11]MDO6487788.1 Holliday junction branch migration protein RuvA [Colwellia sp. 6_MG-2023]MDO6505621.1 Holliday junction branch migration protein RuvA [Colwellia sp. 5_MG-2023]MDO6554083.1 Holliday junction branch migration protein RuvA [Colwellia sp. 4_MG-2023]MDO6651045.1 Holliday junction branch migration protein RuvA [Colwell